MISISLSPQEVHAESRKGDRSKQKGRKTDKFIGTKSVFRQREEEEGKEVQPGRKLGISIV